MNGKYLIACIKINYAKDLDLQKLPVTFEYINRVL
jgi:hypothetical protein